ncbi:MAG: M23 family metallopeptidase [Chloroflexi bacterium]|nr:M23 family metallopeptidase [Chloroflexota bacterium]
MRWFLAAVAVAVAAAAAAAVIFHEDAVAPAPAEPVAADPTPATSAAAVAGATPATPEDVVEPAEPAEEAESAVAQSGAAASQATETAPASDETTEETPDPAATETVAAQPSDAPAEDPDAATDVAAAPDDAQPPPAAEAAPAPPDPPAPVPPAVSVTPAAVKQGQATLVVLSGDVEADGAFVSIDGYTGEMVFEEGVGWVGFVPVTRLANPRLYHVVVDVFNEGSYSRTFVSELLVESVPGVIDEVVLDPDNAALLAPELVAIDNETRFEQYTQPTGPRMWSGPWRLPVVGEPSGDFGVMRSYNGGPVRDWHHGYDISADAGTVIVAPARGRVVFATDLPVHGSGVILDHGAGVYSGYWHMSEIQAEVGQLVNPGDPLGLVGSTGVSTGPHLHWEVIVQGTDVDPIQWTETVFSS